MIEPAILLAELPTGHENAKPARLLAWNLGTTTRQIGLAVAELRRAGHLVGSGCGAFESGYFLCGTEEDVEIGLRHIRSRAIESMRTVQAVRKAAERQFGAETASLFDLEAS